MYVARILYPVEVLGPGKRVGIWCCGCPRRCKGCSNPELWEFQERYQVSPERIFRLIQKIAEEKEKLLKYEGMMQKVEEELAAL